MINAVFEIKQRAVLFWGRVHVGARINCVLILKLKRTLRLNLLCFMLDLSLNLVLFGSLSDR